MESTKTRNSSMSLLMGIASIRLVCGRLIVSFFLLATSSCFMKLVAPTKAVSTWAMSCLPFQMTFFGSVIWWWLWRVRMMRLLLSCQSFVLWTLTGAGWLGITKCGLLGFRRCEPTNTMQRMMLFFICKFGGRVWSWTHTMTRKCKTWNITNILPNGWRIGWGCGCLKFSQGCCCYGIASSSLHPWLELTVLEFTNCCWLFSSALCVNIMCHALGLQECACCIHSSLLFGVVHFSACCLLLDIIVGMSYVK